MRTFWRSGTMRASASFFEKRSWAVIASSIWVPTLVTGFRDVIGSWKIMATSLPRNSRTSSSFFWTTSWSLKMIRPDTIRPGSGTSRRMEKAVIVFPEPDSPTMPTVSPRETLKLMPSTAWTIPREVKNCVRRSSTRNSGAATALSSHSGIDCVSQSIAYEAERQHGDGQRQRRDEHLVGVGENRLVAILDHDAPARGGWRDADPEVAEGGFQENRPRDAEGQAHDDGAEGVRQQVAQDDLRGPAAGGARPLHELFFLQREDLPTDQPAKIHPADHPDGAEDHEEARLEDGDDHEDEEQIRKRVPDVDEAHQEIIRAAAEVTGDQSDRAADHEIDRLDDQADRQRDARAEHHPAQQIATEVVGPKQMLQAEAGIGVSGVLLERVGDHVEAHQQRREQSVEDKESDEDQPADRDRVAAEALPGVLPEPDLLGIFPIDLLQRDGGRGRHRPSLTPAGRARCKGDRQPDWPAQRSPRRGWWSPGSSGNPAS